MSRFSVRRFTVGGHYAKPKFLLPGHVVASNFVRKADAEAWAAVANDWLMERGAYQTAADWSMPNLYGSFFPNFSMLGPRIGKHVQAVKQALEALSRLHGAREQEIFRNELACGKARMFDGYGGVVLIANDVLEVAPEEIFHGNFSRLVPEFEVPPDFDSDWVGNKRGHYVALQDFPEYARAS